MSKEDDPITGKVAEVISDREVILNRGSSHGVRKGMYFNILDTSSVGIKDPDTGEPLGGFKRIKITVVAVDVAEKITLAQTFRTRRVNVGGQGPDLSAFNKLLSAPKYVEQPETFRVDEETPRPLSPKESIVKTGDPFEEGSAADADNARSVAL
ncbi:MAG: hypothetical protein ACQEXN_03865 [Actinomycetota bacterium]